MKVFLDSEEQSWLNRNSQRSVLGLRSLPEREQRLKAREIACWVSIIDKLMFPEADGSYNFNRNQLRLMQDLVIQQLAVIGSKTIPAYEARLAKEPKLQGYLDKVNALHSGLLILSGKIQEAL